MKIRSTIVWSGLLSLMTVMMHAEFFVKTLISSGTTLTYIAGVRFLGDNNKFLITNGGPNANIIEINKRAKVLGVAVPTETVEGSDIFYGFADDLALTSDNTMLALSGLANGNVTKYNELSFAVYGNPQAYNVGPPNAPLSPSQLGFANPVAYDSSDTLYAANSFNPFVSNSVFRMDLISLPFEFRLFNLSTMQFDTTTFLNAFSFAPNGKLYAPAPSEGFVLEIDLVEGTEGSSTGGRAEYTELITGTEGLEQPISVKVNSNGLLVVIDRTTGFVWKFDLNSDTQPTFVASLEPGLDNFDFFDSNKILVTANRNRIWTVNLSSGRVKAQLASPVALPNAISAGKSIDDVNILYVADTYALVLVNACTGCVENVLTPFNTPGLSDLTFISAVHVSETKIYVTDNRVRRAVVLDRETLAKIDLFGGFIPPQAPFSQMVYPLEDDQGNLLLTLPSVGQVIRVTRNNLGSQVNEVIVDNVPVPLALARDGSTLYISDLGTTDTNGAVYTYDLSGSSTTATLLRGNLARPKGLTISKNKVLVVESAAAQITAIDQNGNAQVIADNLEIQYAPGQTTFSNPIPVGTISDITTVHDGTVFFGTNLIEGSIQYLKKISGCPFLNLSCPESALRTEGSIQ